MTVIQCAVKRSIQDLKSKTGSLPVASTAKKPLPVPFQDLSASNEPPRIVGIKIHLVNPGSLDLIINPGHGSYKVEGDQFIRSQEKLTSLMKAAVHIPESKIYVSLSSDEPHRIISPELDGTLLGCDLLEGDIRLKRYLPKLLDISTELGAEFWQELGEKYFERDGLSLYSSFIRVWVCPQTFRVLEKKFMESDEASENLYKQFDVKLSDAAFFVFESTMQAQCKVDRQALQNFLDSQPALTSSQRKLVRDFKADFLARFKDLVIPILNRAINQSPAFHVFQQAYDAIGLSCCYKKALKKHVGAQKFIDNGKPDKMTTYQVGQRMKSYNYSLSRGNEPQVLTEEMALTERETEINFSSIYYREYLDLYVNGSAKSSFEELNPKTNQLITKHYFSGALDFSCLSGML